MKCIEIEENIVDYIDLNLPEREMEFIERHIKSCENCKILINQTKKVFEKFNNLSVIDLPQSLDVTLDAMLKKEKEFHSNKAITISPKRIIPLKYLQIAASIVILLFGYLIGHYSTNKKVEMEILALKDNTLLLKKDLILSKLDSKSPMKRIMALDEAMSFGSMDSNLIEALKDKIRYDSNVNVRLASVLSLSNFEKLDVFTTELIEALVIEKNPSVQFEIVQALAKIGDKKAIIPMQELLAKVETFPLVKSEINYSIAQLN